MRTHKLSNLTKALILVIAILAIGVGLVVWKKKVGGESHASFNSISREEIEMLLADVSKTNPMILKKLAEDPEMKKQQIENLKQLLAFASQAQRDGLAAEPSNRQELDNIRSEILAVNYDREINKDKGPMPAFGFITEDQIKAYWGEDEQPKAGPGFWEKIGLGGTAEQRTHQAEFDDFLNAKITVLKAGNPEMKDREISDEEKTQARDIFAKIRIYRAEYEQKTSTGELSGAKRSIPTCPPVATGVARILKSRLGTSDTWLVLSGSWNAQRSSFRSCKLDGPVGRPRESRIAA